MLGLVFGATTLAVTTVLAAFMGGLALGSVLGGRYGARFRRPLLVYGIIEICIAIFALAVPLLFNFIGTVYPFIWRLLDPSFLVSSFWRFLLSSALLLFPTTLMGATLPILSAALLRTPDFHRKSIARLYGFNLAGAIGGTISAGFWLLPNLGVRKTIYVAAAINLFIGLSVFLFEIKKVGTAVVERSVVRPESRLHQPGVTDSSDRQFWIFCAFVSGFVTICMQVAWTRVITMIIGSSTYAFSMVVGVFLLGLLAGAFIISRHNFAHSLRRTILLIEAATAASLYLSLIVVSRLPGWLVTTGLRLNLRSWLGLLSLQLAAAALLILLPALLLGTVLPVVLVWTNESESSLSVRRVGRTVAFNTMGAIAGAFSAGFLLIPFVGTKFTILFAAALSLIVAGVAYEPRSDAGDRHLRRSLAIGAIPLLILVLFFFAPRINLAELSVGAYDGLIRELASTREAGVTNRPNQGPEIHKLLMYDEGITATVSVRRDWDTVSLAINGRTNASDIGDMPTQIMLGQLPLLLAPNTRNGLVVGFASGVTVGSVLQSGIESLDCVELEPATLKASRFFEHVNNRPLEDPRLRLIVDDARTLFQVSPARYDFIVSEPSHPWVPGVANLFTREFFQLGRDRLVDKGVFVQWLQIYQLSTDSLKSVLATFNVVFPYVRVFRVGGLTRGKDLILVGSRQPLSLDQVGDRIRAPRTAAETARAGLHTVEDLMSWYICDEVKLGPAVAGATINTDDNMHIETTVPREAFLPFMESNSEWISRLK